MTPYATADDVRQWLAELMPLYGLSHWRVDLQCEHVEALAYEGGPWGRTEIDYDLEAAWVRIALQRPRAAVRATLVHELIHLVVAPYECLAHRCCEQLAPQAAEIMDDLLDAANERVVRRVAMIVHGGDEDGQ